MNLNKLLEKLTSFEPSGFPVVSVYLKATANEQGRDEFQTWLRNEISLRRNDFEAESAEAQSFEKDVERIMEFIEKEIDPSAQGAAIFACSGADFFETLQIEVPFPNNRLLVFERSHIFPLARVIDQNPPYLALWADTNKADIYIFGGNEIDAEANTEAHLGEIQSTVTQGTKVGGWSQARYQRHIANFHLKHAKEVVDEVEELMRRRKIEHLILCGDETGIIPILREQLPKSLEDSVIGVLNLSQYDSQEKIHNETLELMRQKDEEKDAERLQRVVDAAKAAAGLGALGVKDTLTALSNGQVEELIIGASFDAIKYRKKEVEEVLEAYAPGDDNSVGDELPEASEPRQIADELLIRAINSAAKIYFIEDSEQIKQIGGVGAVLRYNINATANG